MSGDVLALVVKVERDYKGGRFVDYDVTDSRTGEALATRSEMSTANEIAVYLNSTYPIAGIAPAYDSLVHEIIGFRISGEAPMCLDSWWLLNRPSPPWGVPIGPGWDHLIDTARGDDLSSAKFDDDARS
jgi:hypothetical protein